MKTFIVSIGLLLFSCKEKSTSSKHLQPINQDEVVTMNSISNYDSIVKVVKSKGDTLAYSELYYHLKDSDKVSRTDTLMYYAKIMAQKFNKEGAYLDYLEALCEKYNIDIDYPHYDKLDISKMPEDSKMQTKEWLNKMLSKNIITKEQYESIKK